MFYIKKLLIKWGLGIGDWGLGIGDWAIPNPQSPIPIFSNMNNKNNNNNNEIISNN